MTTVAIISNSTDHFCHQALLVRVMSHHWLINFLHPHHIIHHRICHFPFHWVPSVYSFLRVSPAATLLFQSSDFVLARAYTLAKNPRLASSSPSDDLLLFLHIPYPPSCFQLSINAIQNPFQNLSVTLSYLTIPSVNSVVFCLVPQYSSFGLNQMSWEGVIVLLGRGKGKFRAMIASVRRGI